ncbi:bifunctional chorismate-binding protein/class IV aminotransferase [Helicobacter mustelae]|uniref:Para-aminobenzoate synthase component I n=1 Tax=Helicobacter mustelae (strain ATCC 43772 / CCUG 25715 / CIP 103759 / LMG 18044 / NCTC 12198 / R85-136P) TaxID=679897 RepID=D3UH34_HELM1|nr:bifunctional chorismate-binding protein/class IV aminotransferase [Helicobacter mustelae]CBG39806.1 para-aminobenzoate synthase component I [Helicobacter mustelae 12198]SQH71314.1 para-aminobenzoate synthase component I [Helicobacter mustelae]
MIFGEYLYTQSVCKIVAFCKEEFLLALKKLDDLRRDGYLVGYIRYEAYHLFSEESYSCALPLLYFELFKKREIYNNAEKSNKIFYPSVMKSQGFSTYAKRISQIKTAIKRGDTYQLNYTYKIKLLSHCDSPSIFSQILSNQQTPYSAWISNEYEEIFSFSPELFFELRGDEIITKPMKGTIGRSRDLQQDEGLKKFLSSDVKNRSENVMIVDLLRNDLSKISEAIEVPALFEVITLKTLHQMISTIKAKLRQNVSFAEIFLALFPCGSVTGTPKKKTLEIIQALEGYERGVYCGMIGVMDGDGMCFSVPIRTLTKDAEGLSLCVGSGIVWDSDARAEYEESLLKSQFIYPQIHFSLIETMRVRGGKIQNFSLHKKRLLKSVRYFGFCKPDLSKLSYGEDGVLRIEVDKKGRIQQEFKKLVPIVSTEIKFALRQEWRNDFLHHKSSYAPWYQEARERIAKGEVFDCIFYNPDGEISEGARSNIILELDGMLYTPRKESGLLNGIMRQKLLKQGKIKERALYLSDLQAAQRIFCINALRGMVEVFCQNFPSISVGGIS